MFIYDCEAGFVPDDGQNDVKDGSVENYPLDWDEEPQIEVIEVVEFPCGCARCEDDDDKDPMPET